MGVKYYGRRRGDPAEASGDGADPERGGEGRRERNGQTVDWRCGIAMTGAAGCDSGDGDFGRGFRKVCFEERDEGEGFWERGLKRDSGQRGCRQEIPEIE